jgi:CRP/FNR family cyclic AMP-dependent transcriptional regulator
MIKRFQGSDGERHLLTALKNNFLVEHNEEIAKRLIKIGELVSFEKGDTIITQHDPDNDIFFILAGEVDVAVNHRHVAVRKPGQTIGEMSLLDPARPRSATVSALSNVILLKVPETDFDKLSNDFPRIWKLVAKTVSERLDQRAALLSSPNPLPSLFIGCSTESLKIAKAIQQGLKHSGAEVIIWTDHVFGPSGVPVDDLLSRMRESDFAMFVFTPDDKVVSKNEEYNAPRDNVIFELGLFMGSLDRKRTFIVKEHNTDVKIPSDLLGITQLTYYGDKPNLAAALGPLCTEVTEVIKNLGVR